MIETGKNAAVTKTLIPEVSTGGAVARTAAAASTFVAALGVVELNEAIARAVIASDIEVATAEIAVIIFSVSTFNNLDKVPNAEHARMEHRPNHNDAQPTFSTSTSRTATQRPSYDDDDDSASATTQQQPHLIAEDFGFNVDICRAVAKREITLLNLNDWMLNNSHKMPNQATFADILNMIAGNDSAHAQGIAADIAFSSSFPGTSYNYPSARPSQQQQQQLDIVEDDGVGSNCTEVFGELTPTNRDDN